MGAAMKIVGGKCILPSVPVKCDSRPLSQLEGPTYLWAGCFGPHTELFANIYFLYESRFPASQRKKKNLTSEVLVTLDPSSSAAAGLDLSAS